MKGRGNVATVRWRREHDAKPCETDLALLHRFYLRYIHSRIEVAFGLSHITLTQGIIGK